MRGGTDGSRLTERSLPMPNLFAGMQNIHGPLEWVSVQDIAKAVDVCVALAREWARARNTDGGDSRWPMRHACVSVARRLLLL